MDKKELYATLEELRTGQIGTDVAMEQILLLFSVVGKSEQLKAFLLWLDKDYEIGESADVIVSDYLKSL